MRAHFRFTLSWLIIASLVIGAFLGGISVGWRCHELENQRAHAQLDSQRAQLVNERLRLDQMMRRLHMLGDKYETESW
jgi:hypothetical protein